MVIPPLTTLASQRVRVQSMSPQKLLQYLKKDLAHLPPPFHTKIVQRLVQKASLAELAHALEITDPHRETPLLQEFVIRNLVEEMQGLDTDIGNVPASFLMELFTDRFKLPVNRRKIDFSIMDGAWWLTPQKPLLYLGTFTHFKMIPNDSNPTVRANVFIKDEFQYHVFVVGVFASSRMMAQNLVAYYAPDLPKSLSAGIDVQKALFGKYYVKGMMDWHNGKYIPVTKEMYYRSKREATTVAHFSIGFYFFLLFI